MRRMDFLKEQLLHCVGKDNNKKKNDDKYAVRERVGEMLQCTSVRARVRAHVCVCV